VDNGPNAISDSANDQLYTPAGIEICQSALRKGGCLAIWTAKPSKDFEKILMGAGLHIRRYSVPAYKGSHQKSRFIWVAAESKATLPPGGGEPRPPQKKHRRR